MIMFFRASTVVRSTMPVTVRDGADQRNPLLEGKWPKRIAGLHRWTGRSRRRSPARADARRTSRVPRTNGAPKKRALPAARAGSRANASASRCPPSSLVSLVSCLLRGALCLRVVSEKCTNALFRHYPVSPNGLIDSRLVVNDRTSPTSGTASPSRAALLSVLVASLSGRVEKTISQGQGLTKAKMAECAWLRPILVGQFQILHGAG